MFELITANVDLLLKLLTFKQQMLKSYLSIIKDYVKVKIITIKFKKKFTIQKEPHPRKYSTWQI